MHFDTPPEPEVVTEVGGKHPTGMHTCDYYTSNWNSPSVHFKLRFETDIHQLAYFHVCFSKPSALIETKYINTR